MSKDNTFVVGLTLSPSDKHLLSYAMLLARIGMATRMSFIHVADPAHSIPDTIALREQLQHLVESVFCDLCHRIECTFEVRRGARIDQLVSFIQEISPGYVLLGHRENRRGRRSLAQRLAMICPSSVWMVHDGAPCEIRRILAPIDFSSHSADALALAAHIAKLAGHADCLGAHVYFDTSTLHGEDHEAHIRGNEELAFSKFMAPLGHLDVRVRPVFVESPSVTTGILDLIEERNCDLVVMSTRGRSAAAAVLLGSETSHTLMESPAPVLAVKHWGAALGFLEALLDAKIWAAPDPKTN